LLSVPGELIDELAQLGYTKDVEETSRAIEEGYTKGLKRKHQD